MCKINYKNLHILSKLQCFTNYVPLYRKGKRQLLLSKLEHDEQIHNKIQIKTYQTIEKSAKTSEWQQQKTKHTYTRIAW